jgi:archaemetzincin
MKFGIFVLILAMMCFRADGGERILLVPLGDNVSDEVMGFLKHHLTAIFNAEVIIGKQIPIPENAFNPVRKQYNSSKILHNYRKPEGYDKALLITDVDLYTQGLNFVFGEADIRKGVAIISLTRLHPSFYGLPENKDLFRLRALKEAVHEIAHLYGLRHCPDPKCVMHFSNSILDSDRKSYKFCPVCKKKLEGKIEKSKGE